MINEKLDPQNKINMDSQWFREQYFKGNSLAPDFDYDADSKSQMDLDLKSSKVSEQEMAKQAKKE
jgi:hypothetical protein